MSDEKRLYVESRISNEKKSALVAYLLWFFLGLFGAHRLYLRRYASGVAQFSLMLIGTLTAPILIGYAPLLILSLWWVLDIVLISGMIDRDVRDMRAEFSLEP